jgi:hypothetical protein
LNFTQHDGLLVGVLPVVVEGQHGSDGFGTVTAAVAAFAALPRPALSTSHSLTVYAPGPGAVNRAAPEVLTATGAGQEDWQSWA